MKAKEYVVIGMGEFGTSVARTLANSGVAVIAIDREEKNLEGVIDVVTHTICADVTNPEAMKQVGISDCDVAIVAIGNDLESNMLITIQLKEMGIPYIMAKASSDLEGRLLKKIGADKIVFPDKHMGTRVATEFLNSNYYEAIELSESYSMINADVPEEWIGKSLVELNVRARYGINIVGIKNGEEININPRPDVRLRVGDEMIVLGHNADLMALEDE